MGCYGQSTTSLDGELVIVPKAYSVFAIDVVGQYRFALTDVIILKNAEVPYQDTASSYEVLFLISYKLTFLLLKNYINRKINIL
jgi:hypothetical protein